MSWDVVAVVLMDSVSDVKGVVRYYLDSNGYSYVQRRPLSSRISHPVCPIKRLLDHDLNQSS